MKNAGLAGVTMHHRKLAKMYEKLQDEEKQEETERSEYEDDEEDNPPSSKKRKGVNIADFAKKLKADGKL